MPLISQKAVLGPLVGLVGLRFLTNYLIFCKLEIVSPELPIFGRKFTRRQILWGLGSGVTTFFLSGCEESSNKKDVPEAPKASEAFPERVKLAKIVLWKEESPSSLKEIEKGIYLFGLFIRQSFSQQKIFVRELESGQGRELSPPIKNSERLFPLTLSPQEDQVAVCIYEGKNWDRSYRLFAADLKKGVFRELSFKGKGLRPGIGWSPDEKFLVVYPQEEPLCVIESSEGKIIYKSDDKDRTPVFSFGGPRGFSPDSQWFISGSLGSKTKAPSAEALNLKTLEILKLDNFSMGEWFPNGTTFAVLTREDPEKLLLFDFSTRQRRVFPQVKDSFRVVPDGKTIVFYEDPPFPWYGVKVGVLDLDSGQTHSVFKTNDLAFKYILQWDRSVFSSPSEIIFTKEWIKDMSSFSTEVWYPHDIELYKFNFKTGNLLPYTTLKLKEQNMFFERFLDSNWLLVYSLPPEEFGSPFNRKTFEFPTRKWYLFSLASGRNYLVGDPKPGEDSFFSFTFLSEGKWFKSSPSGQEFYFSQGRKYPISSNVRGLLCLSETAQSIPARIGEQIPESLNKLEFQGGDLLSVEGGKAWYLREGKRYEIDDTLRFMRNSRFDRRVYHVPAWLIEKIPVGEGIDRRKEFFIDWDNRIVETQPDGGLMILFIAGFDSSSESQRLTFAQIIEKLKKIGWRDSQILFPTYNVEMGTDSQGGKIIRPYFYTKEHSVRFPPTNRDLTRAYLERLKLLCPRTRFILVGHSQGGDMAFNVAISHPDAVCQVITINSPLKGVDRLLWENLPVDLEDLSFLRACEKDTRCEAIRFYAAEGNNPALSQNVEILADWLKKWEIELFTFSAVNDPLIRTDRALLNNSDTQVDGKKVQLLWEAPEAKLWSAHSTLLGYNPFITQLARVIGPPSYL